MTTLPLIVATLLVGFTLQGAAATPRPASAPSTRAAPATAATATADSPRPSTNASLSDQIVIDAPIDAVWSALTTKAGLEAWMAPHVEVDLRPGGAIRSTYDAHGAVGDANTVDMAILSLQPPRMLSMQPRKLPASLPFADAAQGTWGVFLLDDLGDGRTRLSLSGFGYRDDAASQAMRNFVQASHREALDTLRFHLQKPAGAAPDLAAGAGTAPGIDTTGSTAELAAKFGPAARLVGGEWRIDAAWADGSPLKARERVEWTLDGHSMRSRVWVTKPDGSEYQRYETLWKPAEPGRTLSSTTFAFNGAVTETMTTFEGDDTLLIPPHGAPGGAPVHVRESLVFRDADTMRWTVWTREDAAAGDAGWTKVMEGDWKRVR